LTSDIENPNIFPPVLHPVVTYPANFRKMRHYRGPSARPGRTYWLSASNYYVLSVAIALATFFLVMLLLRDGHDEPYIPAGVMASGVLVMAVVIRRAIINKHQTRIHAARQLERNLTSLRLGQPSIENKLTIEKNAAILRELKRKSDAALVLAKFADGHREVFELCGQYIEINDREMTTVNPGSPRIAALRRGREIAEDFHRRHMLKWAEIEITTLLENARIAVKNDAKVELANQALYVIESTALKYPNERRLVDSIEAINEFIIKTKVTDLVDRAGRAEGRGNRQAAEKHLRNALRELDKSANLTNERDLASEKIKEQLERLADPN